MWTLEETLAREAFAAVDETADKVEDRAGKSHKKSARGNLLTQKCPQLCVIFDKKIVENFHQRRWGPSLPGLCILDPPLRRPSTCDINLMQNFGTLQ